MRDATAKRSEAELVFVKVRGEVDVATARPLFGVPQGSNGVAVVVDMGQVTFMDWSGLNELVALVRRGPVGVVAPPPMVRRLLEIAGVDGLVMLYPTVEEASSGLS
jgi:anti-anti-sigma factor